MNLFALNLVIAFSWAAVSGSFALGTLALGLVAGFVALWATRPLFGPSDYFRRTVGVVGLFGFFLYDLVRSSIAVIYDVITPEMKSRPRMIRMPLDCVDDLQIMLTANLISLTPGTLTVDLSEDGRELVIHAMFADDPDAVVRDLKAGMERRVMEALG